jgi:hypothetical protein
MQSAMDGATFLFDSMVIHPEHKKRFVYNVKIARLSNVLREMKQGNMRVEHVYDY